ncbi:Protein kinase domain and Serine/threonine-/dual specificity protein kinase, catalytic domain and Protein kinase-like domain-containing protein [Strongyloides ratti]|uniref:non-specific serine/threonine protein kinase n=1 Tax=Strongyloides ratti TaxID=34506 RepID=A0A090LD55_STRRB|nr:Protein kinase domain and Serine/threonine-/dual specificity protein kinase, catalytic domain and Protein kinase-like domain-containing protein [Strongyloides ratti]CEF66073.1 Protein kinase domain and Serine/threonine-/dual specificity protein kinase, catalytic domain and Protein kinase-like domain-containing protein [Strongyloides ratti]
MLCCGGMENKYIKDNAFTSPELNNLCHHQNSDNKLKYMENKYGKILGDITNVIHKGYNNTNKKSQIEYNQDPTELDLNLSSFNSNCYEEENFKELIQGYLPHHHLGEIIGQGGFGKVYHVSSYKSNRKYAVKFLKNKESFEQEYQILSVVTKLQNEYFCKIYRAHCSSDGAFFVLSLQGKNLKCIMNGLAKKRFSGSSGLRIGYQMLEAIKYFHSTGYIHRDIKLSNFVLSSENDTKIKLIDFGICRAYKRRGKIIELGTSRKPKRYIGTLHYCSLPIHNLTPASPRDDIESWFYSCMQALQGKVPWYKCRKEDYEIVKYMKEELRTWECEQIDASKYRTIFPLLQKIDKLGYYDEINYQQYQNHLEKIMSANDIKMDDSYDWQN